MGFTLTPFGPGELEASAELQQFKDLTQQLRTLITQEAGFSEVSRKIDFHEALKNVSASERREWEVNFNDATQLQTKIAELKRDGIDPNERIDYWTAERRELGIPVQSLTLAELEQQSHLRMKEIQEFTDRITKVTEFQKTPERMEQEARLKELQTIQENVFKAQAKEQLAAFEGEPELSPTQKTQFDAEFKSMAEAARRKGIDVEGDSYETAIAEGTAGQSFLKNFQQRVDLAKEARRESVLGRNPMYQAASGMVPGFGPGYAGALPAGPSLAGFQAVQGGFNPFFQNKQLDLQQQALNAQINASKSGGSGKSGLIGSLAGAGIGAALAFPTGGMSMLAGAQLGSMFGGGAGALYGGGY